LGKFSLIFKLSLRLMRPMLRCLKGSLRTELFFVGKIIATY
jgi:hypothetical protein